MGFLDFALQLVYQGGRTPAPLMTNAATAWIFATIFLICFSPKFTLLVRRSLTSFAVNSWIVSLIWILKKQNPQQQKPQQQKPCQQKTLWNTPLMILAKSSSYTITACFDLLNFCCSMQKSTKARHCTYNLLLNSVNAEFVCFRIVWYCDDFRSDANTGFVSARSHSNLSESSHPFSCSASSFFAGCKVWYL